MRLALTKTHLPLQVFFEFIWKYTHAQSVYLCAAFEQLRGFVLFFLIKPYICAEMTERSCWSQLSPGSGGESQGRFPVYV